MSARWCPIAPGRGCACCEEVEHAVASMWRTWRIGVAITAALLLATGVVLLSLSAA